MPSAERLPLDDRADAGRRLALRLSAWTGPRTLLLALPRGGVLVAAEIARELDLPLDILVIRKVAAPHEPEYGLGSVSEFGDLHLDERRVRETVSGPAELVLVIEAERSEARRRAQLYRRGGAPPELQERTVVLVDDGLATGGTMEGAIYAVRARGAGHVVVAVGVGPADTVERLRPLADEVVCLATPHDFFAVGGHYRSFEPVSDEEVLRALSVGMRATSVAPPTRDGRAA
jgi:putative phosphoribosyl transferase